MTAIGSGRPLRVCDLCGGVDDHPRHSIVGTIPRNPITGENGPVPAGMFPAPSDDIVALVLDAAPKEERARLLRELMDTTTSDRHLDCCAAAGCPNSTCGPLTAGANGKTGKAMMTHLLDVEDPFTDRADVVRGRVTP